MASLTVGKVAPSFTLLNQKSEKVSLKDFKVCVGKYVRKDHIRVHGHWMRSKLVENKLKIVSDFFYQYFSLFNSTTEG